MKNRKTYTLDYSSYLNESRQYTSNEILLSLTEYLNVLKENSNIVRPIFRGSDYTGQNTIKYNSKVLNNSSITIGYVIPRQKRNSSSYKSNSELDAFWSVWFDNNEKWKQYPSRKYSANICTTSYDFANNFGYTNIVIPLNIKNTKFGICPKNDMFRSFNLDEDDSKNTLIDFSHYILSVLNYIQKYTDDIKFNTKYLYESYEELINVLNYIQEYFNVLKKDKNLDIDKIDDEFINFSIKKFINLPNNITLFEYVEKLLDPKNNNFLLVEGVIDFLEIVSKERLYNNEVWFNGDYINLNNDNFFQYRNIVNEKSLYIELIEEAIGNLIKIDK